MVTPRIHTIVAVFGCATIAAFAMLVALHVTNPLGEYTEGIVLYLANSLAQGEALYAPLGRSSFAIPVNYTPLYIELLATIGKITPLSYGLARAVNVVIFAGIVAVCARLGWHMFRERMAVLLTIFLLVAPSIVLHHLLQAHVDALAILFDLSGILVVFRERSRLRLLVAAALFVLAWLTKPLMLAGVGAVLLLLIIEKRRRALLDFGIAYVCFLGAAIAALQLTSAGWFLEHLRLTAVASVMMWQSAGIMLGQILLWNGMVFVLAVFHARTTPPRTHLLRLLLLTSAITSLAILRVGASYQYAFELLAVAAILAAGEILRLFRLLPRHRASALMLAGFLLVLLPVGYVAITIPIFAQKKELHAEIASALSKYDQTALLENSGLVSPDISTQPFEFFMVSQLSRKNEWDEQPFRKKIATHSFSAIVLETNIIDRTIGLADRLGRTRFTDGMMSDILASYTLARTIPLSPTRSIWIFEPNRGTL
ncbi:MAG: hypothetical protein HYV34_01905 [Candidatus Kerfeldbacteria bacterium]|nr:hypothetical protein [Candidatus Kerfeldbacteria bacterium]